MLRTPDFDADGTIGFGDFLQFSGQFGKEQGEDGFEGRFDLNDDGAVGFPDFLMFTTAFVSPVAAKPTLLGAHLPEVGVGVNNQAAVALHLVPGQREDEVNVAVRVSNAEGVAGYGFTLQHDPSLLTFVSATSSASSHYTESNGPALNVETSPGEVRLADMLEGNTPEEGDLVRLTFRSIGNTTGATVDIADAMIADGLGGLNELLGAHLGSVAAYSGRVRVVAESPESV